MHALVIVHPGEVELRDIPVPKPGPFEALVRIQGCGICSTTDWELIHGRQPYHRDYPAILGHEAIGEVVETGVKVVSFKVGDRVTRPVALWPGEKRDGLASAWGGFAEYGLVRDRMAMKEAGDFTHENDYTAQRQNVISPRLSLEEAILAISLSETASWFRHLPSVAGKSVCIAGTGIAGLSMILWSQLAGAERIFVLGRRDERLDLALRLGATHVLNVRNGGLPSRLREANEGRGVDFFLEAVGLSDQIEVGLSLLTPGGMLAVYGAPEGLRYDLSWTAGPGWAHIAQFPAEEHRAFPWITRLLERSMIPVKELMTHRWKLDEHRDAFAAVHDGLAVKAWLEI
jgi:threonine dehydrogenase-like Zn-dependent dehydrogenase